MTVVIVSATPETHVLIRQTSSDWLRIRQTSSDWLELHALTHAAVCDAADSQETNVTVVIASATPETSVLIRQTSSDWSELHALTHAAVCDAADSQETNVTVVIVSATPETRVLIRQTSSDWLEPPIHFIENCAMTVYFSVKTSMEVSHADSKFVIDQAGTEMLTSTDSPRLQPTWNGCRPTTHTACDTVESAQGPTVGSDGTTLSSAALTADLTSSEAATYATTSVTTTSVPLQALQASTVSSDDVALSSAALTADLSSPEAATYATALVTTTSVPLQALHASIASTMQGNPLIVIKRESPSQASDSKLDDVTIVGSHDDWICTAVDRNYGLLSPSCGWGRKRNIHPQRDVAPDHEPRYPSTGLLGTPRGSPPDMVRPEAAWDTHGHEPRYPSSGLLGTPRERPPDMVQPEPAHGTASGPRVNESYSHDQGLGLLEKDHHKRTTSVMEEPRRLSDAAIDAQPRPQTAVESKATNATTTTLLRAIVTAETRLPRERSSTLTSDYHVPSITATHDTDTSQETGMKAVRGSLTKETRLPNEQSASGWTPGDHNVGLDLLGRRLLMNAQRSGLLGRRRLFYHEKRTQPTCRPPGWADKSQIGTTGLSMTTEWGLDKDADHKNAMVTTTARRPRKLRSAHEMRDATRLASPRSDLLGTSLTRSDYMYPRTNQTNRRIGMRPTYSKCETSVLPPTTRRRCLRLLGRRKAWTQLDRKDQYQHTDCVKTDAIEVEEQLKIDRRTLVLKIVPCVQAQPLGNDASGWGCEWVGVLWIDPHAIRSSETDSSQQVAVRRVAVGD